MYRILLPMKGEDVRVKDNRKTIKVPSGVKIDVDEIQKELGFNTESRALAYLCAMFRDQKSKRITFSDHQKYVKESEWIHNQGTL